MKKELMSFKKFRILTLGIMVFLLVFGIGLAFNTMMMARTSIFEEHDEHLYDLVTSVDHNTSSVLQRCGLELEAITHSNALIEAEEYYEKTGDAASLKQFLSETELLTTDYAMRIIVRQDQNFLVSSDYKDHLNYRQMDENDGDSFWIIRDEDTGNDYLAISCPSSQSELSYIVLIDLEPFYRCIVVDTIYDEYWTVLYDTGSGLVLQNDNDTPNCIFYSKEEIRERNDGLTKLLEHQEQNIGGEDSFYYTTQDGVKTSNRMSVIPSALSENGNFAISVSVYDTALIQPTQHRFMLMVIAALMIAFGSAMIVFFLLHRGRREKELAERNAALEKENVLTTNLLRQQEEITHHQKLETIGKLTAGVAHEFNNLLTPIMVDSMLIIENKALENTDAYDYAIEIYETSSRAKQLVSKISNLSRKNSADQMHQIFPSELLASTMTVCASAIPSNVVIENDFRSDSKIFGDEVQLGNMFLNLVLNAIQAMEPDGGVLTLSIRDEGDFVILSVSDTGKGIDPKNLSLIFEPFFTTKESGKGTGLGLAIVQRTVNSHGGKIIAENNSSGGANFIVKLPIYKEDNN